MLVCLLVVSTLLEMKMVGETPGNGSISTVTSSVFYRYESTTRLSREPLPWLNHD
jgi:hypothetical protein